jgi:hypothetical protein
MTWISSVPPPEWVKVHVLATPLARAVELIVTSAGIVTNVAAWVQVVTAMMLAPVIPPDLRAKLDAADELMLPPTPANVAFLASCAMLANFGIATAAKIPMMTITMINSISVKPDCSDWECFWVRMVILLVRAKRRADKEVDLY